MKSKIDIIIPKHEWDNTKRTKSVHNLIYKSSPTLNMKTIKVKQNKVPRQGNTLQIQSIKRFVEYNGLGSTDGFINLNQQYEKWIKAPVKKNKITQHRTKELIGQHGVFAQKTIPENICLAQYSGVEYLYSEWHEIYDDCNKYLKHRPYLCQSHFGAYMITIDPIELNDAQFVAYINDYRDNIYEDYSYKKSQTDWKYHNIDFCEVLVNECPAIFMVTRQQIKIGEELCCFYGNDYKNVLNDISIVQEKQMHKRNEYKKLWPFYQTSMK